MYVSRDFGCRGRVLEVNLFQYFSGFCDFEPLVKFICECTFVWPTTEAACVWAPLALSSVTTFGPYRGAFAGRFVHRFISDANARFDSKPQIIWR